MNDYSKKLPAIIARTPSKVEAKAAPVQTPVEMQIEVKSGVTKPAENLFEVDKAKTQTLHTTGSLPQKPATKTLSLSKVVASSVDSATNLTKPAGSMTKLLRTALLGLALLPTLAPAAPAASPFATQLSQMQAASSESFREIKTVADVPVLQAAFDRLAKQVDNDDQVKSSSFASVAAAAMMALPKMEHALELALQEKDGATAKAGWFSKHIFSTGALAKAENRAEALEEAIVSLKGIAAGGRLAVAWAAEENPTLSPTLWASQLATLKDRIPSEGVSVARDVAIVALDKAGQDVKNSAGDADELARNARLDLSALDQITGISHGFNDRGAVADLGKVVVQRTTAAKTQLDALAVRTPKDVKKAEIFNVSAKDAEFKTLAQDNYLARGPYLAVADLVSLLPKAQSAVAQAQSQVAARDAVKTTEPYKWEDTYDEKGQKTGTQETWAHKNWESRLNTADYAARDAMRAAESAVSEVNGAITGAQRALAHDHPGVAAQTGVLAKVNPTIAKDHISWEAFADFGGSYNWMTGQLTSSEGKRAQNVNTWLAKTTMEASKLFGSLEGPFMKDWNTIDSRVKAELQLLREAHPTEAGPRPLI